MAAAAGLGMPSIFSLLDISLLDDDMPWASLSVAVFMLETLAAAAKAALSLSDVTLISVALRSSVA